MRSELKSAIKIKPLTKQQIVISLDRLTRFKHPEDKYLRVFKDIITSNLIEPKYKKSELDVMDYGVIKELAQEIINYSLNSLCPSKKDFHINKKILQYEKSVFKFDKNVEKLIDNKIDYCSAIAFLDDGIGTQLYENPSCSNKNLNHIYPPLNLKWLKLLMQDENQIENRTKFGLKFPIEKVVLVEGITEEILLPKFARILGYDFDKLGINLISAGGKNQVVKLFYQFVENLKLPIFVLLDSDAVENFEEIKPKLRKNDKVHILEKGEFEDVLPLNLIKRTLNQIFRNFSFVSIDDLRKDIRMTQVLDEVFKQRGLEFKKAEFAALIGENISSGNDVSPEIELIYSNLI